MNLHLAYFYSSDLRRKPFSNDRNEGIEAVPPLLRQLQASRYPVEFVDTSNLSENDRYQSYMRVTPPATYKHYEIRAMFGTNEHSACWFGAEVPALLVTDAGAVGDTYPHRKGNHIATIHDFLTALIAGGSLEPRQPIDLHLS